MHARQLVWALGLIVLLGGVAGAAWVATLGWDFRKPTTTSEEPAPFPESPEAVVCFGFVDLEHGLRMLAPTRPGRVQTLFVHEAQDVRADDPLLSLDDRDARLQHEEAQQAVEAAQVKLEQAEKLPAQHQARLAQQTAAIQAAVAKLAAAQQLAAYKQELGKDKLASAREASIAQEQVHEAQSLEQAERQKLIELKLNDPQLAIRAARAEVELARVRVRQAQRQLDECTLRAPTAGMVQRLLVGVGDVVASQPAVQFCPAASRLIRADVEQEFVHRIEVGQLAQIKDDARAGVIWRGTVIRVADWFSRRRPQVQEPTQFLDVRTVECLVAIEPGQPPLRIGQRMRVLIGPGENR